MIHLQVEKFIFRIRTRSGLVVDNLSIQANDVTLAECRLMQMYPGCQILETASERARIGSQSTSYEELIDLIAPPHSA